MISRLRALGRDVRRELKVYQLILGHPGTPRRAKIVLGAAVGYVLLPFDLIPDFIPIIGHLDDLILVPALVLIALKMIPVEVVRECREAVRIDQGDASADQGRI